jgi:hypothetical protein
LAFVAEVALSPIRHYRDSPTSVGFVRLRNDPSARAPAVGLLEIFRTEAFFGVTQIPTRECARSWARACARGKRFFGARSDRNYFARACVREARGIFIPDFVRVL